MRTKNESLRDGREEGGEGGRRRKRIRMVRGWKRWCDGLRSKREGFRAKPTSRA